MLFTEYRDTLDYILGLIEDEPWADEILVIHGGVSKDERARIEEEFNHGQSRLLFATDAASEGIDLQHSCHIMVNYELPWNPNRLEQRIGRIHRYGQDKEVKVWNFSFEETREGEIFELLQEKVESIRSQLGNTADVLGMLDDIDMDSLIMESIQHGKPPSATKAELEEMIDDRQQTLEEWYERSLIDTTTFDAESRRQIQEVVDDSTDIYGSETEIREFFRQGITTLGGEFHERSHNLYSATLPERLVDAGEQDEIGPFTFDREFAMDHDGIEYIAPGSEVLSKLIQAVTADSSQGKTGLKILPFVDTPGITYNYRLAFEDGTGEMIREEMIPVFVDVEQRDAQRDLGKRVVEGQTITARPDTGDVDRLLNANDTLRQAADRYVSSRITKIKQELQSNRQEEIAQDIEKLDEYARAERSRIEEFIEEYERQADAGGDMDIAIRGQQQRLQKLEERIEERRRELQQKERIVSLAPEVENFCLALPV